MNAISVNGKYYKTVKDAFERVKKVNGEGYTVDKDVTITLYKDIVEDGLVVKTDSNSLNVVIDFNGHTYTIDGTVGSTNTTTNGFQLNRNCNVTLKNGTLTSSKSMILIQNYSNLTLDNMILDGKNLDKSSVQGPYTLSTNNGNTKINNTTIYAHKYGIAFDVCSFASYTGNTVEVLGNSNIEGNIELSTFNDVSPRLILTNGKLNGKLVMSTNANKCIVTKSSNFNVDAPNGYAWDDSGVLVKNS